MAASLASPSPSFRTSQLCLSIHSTQLQNMSVRLQNPKGNNKLYMIPGGAFSQCFVFKCLATAGSLDVDGTFQRNQGRSSHVWGPNDSARSEELLDISKNPVISDLEIELQELFEEVKSMVRMGNKNDALDVLKANYEAVKEQTDAGSRGIEEAAILDVIALGYMFVGDLKMVGSLLDMLNELVNSLQDKEPLLTSVLTHMGSLYSTLGKSEKSLLLYRRVLEIIEREYGNDSILLITPLLGMGKALVLVGRATKAIEMYQRAITIVESCRGAESEQLVVPLSALGNLLIKEGKATDAESTYIRILNIYTKIYGENDGRVGMAMCSLANVKCAKGNIDEAIHLYRNALQVLKDAKNVTLDDDIMEKMRIDLAELLHVVGRGNEGRALLEECLLIAEKHGGKEHPCTVLHHINLATSYSRSKNYVEAERLLRTGLQIIMKTKGPEDPSITFPMLNLAVTLYNLNQNEEAEQLAREVLRIRENAFGKESLLVGEALDCLVSIQTILEKEDGELLELLKRVLRIQERAFGNDSEEVIETLKKIVYYLDKMGMKNEKFPLQKRLSRLKDKYKQMMVQY